jgi:hypothetical protein
MRLIDELAASSNPRVVRFEPLPGEPIPVMVTTAAWIDRCDEIQQKLDAWLDMASEIVLAAERAHSKRLPGNPGGGGSLLRAVYPLAFFWTRTLKRRFKLSKWARTSEGVLVPLGATAAYLFDAMKIIDPARQRLGEELRNVMVTSKPRFCGDLT